MRRGRRGGSLVQEFGGSGEDSFVAVVVTKLTGALLFILLLTMVIMALIPRGDDRARSAGSQTDTSLPLAILTPEVLPEAIVGRPYNVALSATGGKARLRWDVTGVLPDGLRFDAETGRLHGVPSRSLPRPAELVLRVSDGQDRVSRRAFLTVYLPDRPLSLPSPLAPGLPPIPWNAWMRHGFGFLLLGLVHMVGMGTLASLESRRIPATGESPRRFGVYRVLIRLGTLTAMAGLAGWLWMQGAA